MPAPPRGASPFKTTVPVEDAPPTTVTGFRATLLSPLAPEFNTTISASPVFNPTALLIVNLSQLTLRGAKLTANPAPLFGNVPTDTVLPSLNLKVPERMLSNRFGRSYKFTCDTVTPLDHARLIQAPFSCPVVAHSRL